MDEDVNERIQILKYKEKAALKTNLNDKITQHIIVKSHQDNENNCIACINGHTPTGAHKCSLCNESVHIIKGCSYKIPGQEEGFGEKRICVACFKNNPSFNELNSEENWRGETKKTKKGPNYIQNDPSILFCNDASKTKSPVIGILKNGNRSNLKSIGIGGVYYTASNTCAFDSIFHILCTSYCDSTLYAEYINVNYNTLIFKMVSNAVKDGINVQTYRKRLIILKELCELQELPEKLISIKGDHSIEVMTRKLLENFPSRVDLQNCINCPNQQISHQPILLNINDIKNINKLLLVDGNVNKCSQCNRRLVNPFRYGDHIFLMTTPIIDFSKIPATEKSNGVPLMDDSEAYVSGVQIKLDDIPIHVTIKRHVYKLRGVINLIKPSDIDMESIGHYESYCYRESTNQWELYDDMRNNPVKCKANTNVNAELIIYTI